MKLKHLGLVTLVAATFFAGLSCQIRFKNEAATASNAPDQTAKYRKMCIKGKYNQIWLVYVNAELSHDAIAAAMANYLPEGHTKENHIVSAVWQTNEAIQKTGVKPAPLTNGNSSGGLHADACSNFL